MTGIEQLVPGGVGVRPLSDIVREIQSARCLPPFADDVVGLCAELSKAVFHDREARSHPELQALAFWMRKAELVRLREGFRAETSPDVALLPRGIVFHIPPSNVDTIFVYSWVLSILAGNINVIRLSERAGQSAPILCRLINQVLETAAGHVRTGNFILRYSHDSEVTSVLSGLCDVRVIWGGDKTVSLIRRIPLAPHGRDLTFPDRRSMAVLDADAYLQLDGPGGRDLAERFYNDAYWFDQMACSSPRLIAWRGSERACDEASTLFWNRLHSMVEAKGYTVSEGARLAAIAFAYSTVLESRVLRASLEPALSRLDVSTPESLPEDHCGGGMFFQFRVNDLLEIVPFIQRKDQTLTHFGIVKDDLTRLVYALCGRGVDRLVPVGRALEFGRIWDGYDLLREFSRTVSIQV